ncbi:hypothetical protein ElyMa_006474600 [Elysia marginata]|uniref:Uncharacterized protein n=1 Tax=Elysia marginata TaxID=1093978 RepID=A0AAV4I110_9GAST|nr:hypothetical protein ElyMa_006474600 [Elysia marginata]
MYGVSLSWARLHSKQGGRISMGFIWRSYLRFRSLHLVNCMPGIVIRTKLSINSSMLLDTLLLPLPLTLGRSKPSGHGMYRGALLCDDDQCWGTGSQCLFSGALFVFL